MKELKELFESALLNEETKTVLQEAFEVAIKAKETELEASYAEKLVESEKVLMDSLPKLIEEALAEELASIAEEVAAARTKEIEYAEKLTVFKENFAEKQEELLKVLVAESVAEEFEELKDEIELAKKHEFVMSMFESFKDTYDVMFGGADASVVDKLNEAVAELDAYRRKEKLAGLLESVTGQKRLIAETILEGVSTDKLEEKFESIRPVLLAEGTKQPEEVKQLEDDKSQKVVLEENLNEEEQVKVSDAVLQRLNKSINNAKK